MIERIEINLLPAEYRDHKKAIHLQREVVYPALAVGILWIVCILWTFQLDSTIGQIKSKISHTENMIKLNKPIKDEIIRLKESKTVVQGKIVALEQISVDRAKWVRLMEVVCQRLPDYTWVESCEERDSSIILDGKTFSFPEVANFMSRLSESPYIRSVDLSGIEERGEANTFAFSLTCRLNSKPELKEEISGNPGAKATSTLEAR
jgi:Tfp pilus assembly protein PilN